MDAMTPSKQMTGGQIDKAVANYRALLEKHAPEFDSAAVQTVLGQSEFTDEQLSVFRKRVEAISNMIIHHVVVNRTRSPQKAIAATGRTKYLDDKVVASMPQGEGGYEVEITFFKPDRSAYDKNGNISDDEVVKQFEMRGLKPADPYELAAVNEADPAFADDHPNCTHWKDPDGNWCYAAFGRWDGKRNVNVHRDDNDWDGYWWFAGVPASRK